MMNNVSNRFFPSVGPCAKGKMFHENKKRNKTIQKKQESATYTQRSPRARMPDQNSSVFRFQVVEVVYTVTNITIFLHSDTHIFIHSEELAAAREKERENGKKEEGKR